MKFEPSDSCISSECAKSHSVYILIFDHTKNKSFKPRFAVKLGRANNVGGSDLSYHHPHVLLDML